jgi:hypothetical protein
MNAIGGFSARLRLLYRHKVALAVPWHSRHSEPVAAHGMGAVRFQRDHEPGKA